MKYLIAIAIDRFLKFFSDYVFSLYEMYKQRKENKKKADKYNEVVNDKSKSREERRNAEDELLND